MSVADNEIFQDVQKKVNELINVMNSNNLVLRRLENDLKASKDEVEKKKIIKKIKPVLNMNAYVRDYVDDLFVKHPYLIDKRRDVFKLLRSSTE